MSNARAFGLPQFRYALVREVLTGLTPSRIEEEVVFALDQIIQVLTTAPPANQSKALKQRPAERLRIEGDDALDSFDRMNRQFLEQEWGDGFPLIPPTPDKVERMLKGTTRNASDIITVMSPGNGLATVEMIAINGVMAGCEPIHLPILIATCQAYMGLGFRVRALATSTSSMVPLMMINGPIGNEIGINSKGCALGPGVYSRHNIVLGRALRLMMINIGNCRPRKLDMDTIGSARKFGMCVAENEEESPWKSYHVEKGFDKDASTVTIFATRDEIDVNDTGNFTPEGVLNSFAFFGAIPGGEYLEKTHAVEEPKYHQLLMMCPEHANICGKEGWTKKEIREYIFNHCRASARRLFNRPRQAPDTVVHQWRWLLKLSDSELDQIMLPVMESTREIDIAVVGGAAGKNMLYRGICLPATAVITDRA